ncbi:hypothetical protein [Ferrimonas balearica]|uniref:hypothetical protein n=1 Tax=Ferrimonas balearica TaxID=44012 RepID=UPI001C95A7E6|nr:hypothetical protein [Ferrimonas balearica]MBY5979218.1 hypothetical protein [Ferrimonas balearica]
MLALHPSIFYEKGFDVAAALLGVIGGLLLLVSFTLRLAKEFGSSEPPRWMPVINDFIKSGTMLALYFGAWGMAVSLFNALYALFEDTGSIQAVFTSYGNIFHNYKTAIQTSAETTDSGFSITDFLGGATDSVGTFFGEIASYLFFTLSTLCVMLTYAITKLFHGLLFALAIIWGGLVWSVRPIVNLVKGWLMLTGLVLLWPLMENLVFLFLDLTINDALMKVIPEAGTNLEFGLVALEVVLGVLNLIMAFVLVTIPMITARLLANGDFSLELGSAFTQTAAATQKAVFGSATKTTKSALSMLNKTGGIGVKPATPKPRPGQNRSASPQSPPAPNAQGLTTPLGPTQVKTENQASTTGAHASSSVSRNGSEARSTSTTSAPSVSTHSTQHRRDSATRQSPEHGKEINPSQKPAGSSPGGSAPTKRPQPQQSLTPEVQQSSTSLRSSTTENRTQGQPKDSTTGSSSTKTASASPPQMNTQSTILREPTQNRPGDSAQQARHDALIEALRQRSKARKP